jgi:MOSC domain-containing protein YiiM
MAEGRVHQLNVSQGGVPKLPVARAALHALGLEGDAVRDLRHHGGPERAVCLYALERIEGLQAEGHPVFPGALGENVTIAGLDWAKVVPGTRMQIGHDALLEITRYAVPCNTTAPYVSHDMKRFHQDTCPGWSRVYAKVLREGLLEVGMRVTLQ